MLGWQRVEDMLAFLEQQQQQGGKEKLLFVFDQVEEFLLDEEDGEMMKEKKAKYEEFMHQVSQNHVLLMAVSAGYKSRRFIKKETIVRECFGGLTDVCHTRAFFSSLISLL